MSKKLKIQRAKLQSFNFASVSNVGIYAEKLEKPVMVAIINLDGADGGIYHYLGEVEPQKVKIGMRVKAVFKDKKERVGSILDIKYFKICG